MATSKSTRRRSRKRHSPARGGRTAATGAGTSTARAGTSAVRTAERAVTSTAHGSSRAGATTARGSGRARASTAGGASRAGASTYGERPAGPFGGLPVSELAIFGGLIAVVTGWLRTATPALVAGFALCFLGVLELTAREHFSGYRSHAMLLSLMVAVAVETLFGLLLVPHAGLLLLLAVVPAFAGCFVLLRRRFSVARQARVRAYPLA